MKLHARKSILALGTAAALAFSAVNPAVAETTTNNEVETTTTTTDETTNTSDETTTTTTTGGTTTTAETKAEGHPDYSRYHTEVATVLKQIDERVKALKATIAKRNEEIKKASDPAAERKLDEARTYLSRAESGYNSVSATFKDLPATGEKDDPDYGILLGLRDQLREIKKDLSDGETALRGSIPVSCEDSTGNTDNSGSSAFGSLFDSLGSSGRMSIVKDGKKTCVSKAEYYSEKLTKIVAILGTVFTLITTMTKISDTIQKQALPR